VAADGLDAAVDAWVEDILRCAPLAVRAVKQAAAAAATMPLQQAFQTRYPWEERRMHSADAEEGPLAFVEKRSPQWKAR
jgi:crotonobetainyl-CoA hydratase/dehydration protein DpgD